MAGAPLLEDPYREGTAEVDGRTIAYAEHGDLDGRPVLGFPGNPSSRYGLGWARMYAAAHGVRLVIADRPGIGRSSPDDRRTVSSTALNTCALMDALGVGSFAVLGQSSGGPYALACAAVAPQRVTRAALVAGVGRMWEPGAHDGMSSSNAAFWTRAATGPDATAGDFDAATTPDMHPERRLDIEEALRQGTAGPALDAFLVATQWDVDLGAVRVPVDLWHGALDDDVPLTQAERLAGLLPDAALHVWPEAGHGMPPDAMPDIYAKLVTA